MSNLDRALERLDFAVGYSNEKMVLFLSENADLRMADKWIERITAHEEHTDEIGAALKAAEDLLAITHDPGSGCDCSDCRTYRGLREALDAVRKPEPPPEQPEAPEHSGEHYPLQVAVRILKDFVAAVPASRANTGWHSLRAQEARARAVAFLRTHSPEKAETTEAKP